jgi:hypothetical protein
MSTDFQTAVLGLIEAYREGLYDQQYTTAQNSGFTPEERAICFSQLHTLAAQVWTLRMLEKDIKRIIIEKENTQ